jgi:hypothetical protein
MSAADNFAWKLSRAAYAEAAAVIRQLSPIEPDLAALPAALDSITVDSFTPDQITSAWRGLYLSIYELPRRLILVGSIDAAPELAGLAEDAAELLVVETDSQSVSTAELLPRGTQWRSLSEFGANLGFEDRFKLTTALVHSLQPEAVLIMGSRVGWEMLARHGGAISSYTSLFAAVVASPDVSATNLLVSYLRTCIPVLSILYGPDERALRHIADVFGLSPGERNKLRDLNDWRDAHGFLSASWIEK